MPSDLEATAVSVRLRRLWLGEIARSDELAASDLAGATHDVELRRVADVLWLRTPFDFGSGDPFAGDLGRLLRTRVEAVSRGAVRGVAWEFTPELTPVRRPASADLDVYSPGDPSLADHARVLAALRARIPAGADDAARAAVHGIRLVGVSRHRLWFAARSSAERDALARVPGARGLLVTAIQAVQKHELPLYRVVVDPSYRGRSTFV